MKMKSLVQYTPWLLLVLLVLWGLFATGEVMATPAVATVSSVTIWERLHPSYPDLDSRSTRVPRIERIMGIPVKYYPGRYAPEMSGRTLESFDLNINIFRTVNSNRNSGLDLLFSLLINIGKAGWLFPVVVIMWYFQRKRYQVLPVAHTFIKRIANGFRWFFRRDHITVLLLAQGAGAVVVRLFKEFCSQPRPAILLPNVTLNERVYMGSFPSGDVCFAVSLAVVLFTISTKWWQRTLCVVYALLIGYERMYVGAHFPLDVFTGALIAVVVTVYMSSLILPKMQNGSKKIENELS